MYHRGDIDHWTDAELVELWRERSAIRCCDPNSKEVAQADFDAAKELKKWLANRQMPRLVIEGMTNIIG